MKLIRTWLKHLESIFYPEVCAGCTSILEDYENIICFTCRNDLPFTNFASQTNNPLEKHLYSRMRLVAATSLFYFRKNSIIQEVIHQLKYKNQQQIGTITGTWLGEELLKSNRFTTVDLIVPVPLSKDKLKKRGYNQVSTFGKKLSEILMVPYDASILKRKTAKRTQTKMHKNKRWLNVKNSFEINESQLTKAKHILIVDDVITSGATLEACYLALTKNYEVKVSVASIAFTTKD